MPPERRDPTDPLEWIRRARSNLARARAGPPAPEVLYEDLAFDAQQAAEKGIKAVLVARRVDFRKTHSLVNLLSLVEGAGVVVPADVREAARLTRYAVRTRCASAILAAGRRPGRHPISPVTGTDLLGAAVSVARRSPTFHRSATHQRRNGRHRHRSPSTRSACLEQRRRG